MKNPIRLDYLFLYLIFGRKWRERIWVSKRDKSELTGRIAMASAQVLTWVYDLTPVQVSTSGLNPSVNPSMVKSGIGYSMIARSSRLRCYNDVDYIENSAGIDDVNYLYTLDEEFKTIDSAPLDESLLRERGHSIIHCMSDSRLFYWNDQLWAIGAAARIKDGAQIISQILFRIEGYRVVDSYPLDSPAGFSIEKNWTPVLGDGILRLIYSFSPVNIFKVEMFQDSAGGVVTKNVDELDVFLEQPYRMVINHDVRGGTPLIEYRDGYIGLVHQAPNMWNGRRSYTHSFVWFTRSLELLEVSEPFYLQRKGLEFATGICRADDGIVVSYGVADRACMILKIPHQVIERYLVL